MVAPDVFYNYEKFWTLKKIKNYCDSDFITNQIFLKTFWLTVSLSLIHTPYSNKSLCIYENNFNM